MYFDIYYLILIIPALLLSLYAQYKVKNTFSRYLSVPNGRGITGAEVARKILDEHGLYSIDVEMIDGFLSDHFDPRAQKVRLSREVYNGTSVSSLGVAAHETGHAIQHNTHYMPLQIRNSLIPVASIGGNWIAIPLILLGLLFQSPSLFLPGIIVFSSVVAFQFITMPVEFNASSRALKILGNGFLTQNELANTKKVLNAAALTYVAASTVALAELLRYILLFMGTQRDDE